MDGEIEKELKERFNEAEKEAKLGQNDVAQEMFSALINRCHNLLTTHTHMQANSVRKLLALTYNNRGHLKYLKVEFPDAVTDYTAAIHHHPVLAVAHYNRGLIHYRLGRFDEAVRDLQEALHINPSFTSARQCLDQTLADRVTHNGNV